jgi:hypothetical protein
MRNKKHRAKLTKSLVVLRDIEHSYFKFIYNIYGTFKLIKVIIRFSSKNLQNHQVLE